MVGEALLKKMGDESVTKESLEKLFADPECVKFATRLHLLSLLFEVRTGFNLFIDGNIKCVF